MKYLVSVSYQDCGKDPEIVKERVRKAFGRKVQVTVSKVGEMIVEPRTVFQRLKRVRESKKEMFCVIALDTQNKIIKTEVVSVGTLNASLVHPREVFSVAVRNLAASIIIAHNHPSGSVEPSDEDINVTKRLVEAGKLMGVTVVDHVIITSNNYQSFRESQSSIF